MWNVPLQVIRNIKEILNLAGVLESLPLHYNAWIDAISKIKLKEYDHQISQLIHEAFSLLQDKKIDYHIMNIEGLLKATTEDEEDASYMTLNERMDKVYATTDFDAYRKIYDSDINKKKRLLVECIKYVSTMQEGSFLILKYRPEVNFFDLWNEFYMETRGLVIDINKMKLVSCPYRKFFNLNEKPITQINVITGLINKAYNVTIKNKEDGSMISCSRYNGNLVVSTSGTLNSSQALWAKAFIEKHYPVLMESLPEHLTFIFEAIYPENHIVVDYGLREDLILTNIRNKETGRLLEETEIEYYALLFNLTTPQKETKGLLELMKAAKDRNLYPADSKEGWVFVIRTKDEERLFKLKCDDYCEVHKILSFAISPKIVFQKIKTDTLDDFLSKVPDNIKPLTTKIANVIFNHIERVQEEVQQLIDAIPSSWLYTPEEVNNYYEFIDVLSQNILPQINPKLSKNAKSEIEQILLKLAFGKEISADKWTMSEAKRLWDLIPDNLKNQRNYIAKSGRLIGYIKTNIPDKYRNIIFNYVEHRPYQLIDVVKYRDIDFVSVNKELSKFEDEN
jgi:RNA ligase